MALLNVYPDAPGVNRFFGPFFGPFPDTARQLNGLKSTPSISFCAVAQASGSRSYERKSPNPDSGEIPVYRLACPQFGRLAVSMDVRQDLTGTTSPGRPLRRNYGGPWGCAWDSPAAHRVRTSRARESREKEWRARMYPTPARKPRPYRFPFGVGCIMRAFSYALWGHRRKLEFA